MQTATSSGSTGRWQALGSGLGADQESSQRHAGHDFLQLVQENARLRQSCAHLTTAAETWIRLYESALTRANAAEARIAAGAR